MVYHYSLLQKFAVGLTTVFLKQFTEYGISANVVTGNYCDHTFVPKNKAKLVIEALCEPTK